MPEDAPVGFVKRWCAAVGVSLAEASALSSQDVLRLAFVIVAAVFMHLRYDLRSYRFYFTIGLAGALVVFAVVMVILASARLARREH